MPPVSSNSTSWPFNAIFRLLMSRVVPAKSEVIAILSLARRLNSELFPTLGWPKIAMVFKVLWLVFIFFIASI